MLRRGERQLSSYSVEASIVGSELDAWIIATYPDVEITRNECLVLRSEARSEVELRLILTAAKVNEHSLHAGGKHRAMVMGLLLG